MPGFDRKDHDLFVSEVTICLPAHSYEHAIRYDKDASIAENGALVAYSGAKTGRSPRDKRIVKNPDSEKDIWWGEVNVPLDARTYDVVRDRARDYLNICERLYRFDGYAGWGSKYCIKVRVIQLRWSSCSFSSGSSPRMSSVSPEIPSRPACLAWFPPRSVADSDTKAVCLVAAL